MADTRNLNEIMAAFAEDAVPYARHHFGIELDYSVASIERVEEIAASLHATRPRGFLARLLRREPSPRQVEILCRMLGGYLGEVFRRVRGGDWEVFREEGVSLGVRYAASSWIFPPTKVYKRLTNGSEDDLVFYFEMVTQDD